MRNVLLFAPFFVACEGEPSPNPPASVKDAEPVAVAPSPAASAPSPVGPTGRCVTGWRATMNQRMGVASYTLTIECSYGWPRLRVDFSEQRDNSRLVTLYWSDWATLWQELEAAHWRNLSADCPGITALELELPYFELEITDGHDTKSVTCLASTATQHLRIMKAFEHALARLR